MAQFDQRGQKVRGPQYNAGRDMNIGAGQSAGDIVTVLEDLKKQLEQAQDNGSLSEEVSTDAIYHVTKALQQAKKPNPDKKTILDYLNTAKDLVANIAAAGGLVTSLINAAEIVRKVF